MSIPAILNRAFTSSHDRPFLPSPWRTARLMLQTGQRNLFVGRNFRIINKGVLELADSGTYRFGTSYYGFLNGGEKSIIRIGGKLVIQGSTAIAAGAKWDVGAGAQLTIGKGTYFSPHTLIVATDGVTIGSDCAIAWGVQILDADFHSHGPIGDLDTVSRSQFTAPITIGNRVWVGSNAQIYKGVSIADGCIVAGGSVVTKSISEPNVIVAGVPAQIVRRGIEWQ